METTMIVDILNTFIEFDSLVSTDEILALKEQYLSDEISAKELYYRASIIIEEVETCINT